MKPNDECGQQGDIRQPAVVRILTMAASNSPKAATSTQRIAIYATWGVVMCLGGKVRMSRPQVSPRARKGGEACLAWSRHLPI